MLASTRTAVAATQTGYLPGLQFDVHVTTQRALEVDSALARNMQAEADVRDIPTITLDIRITGDLGSAFIGDRAFISDVGSTVAAFMEDADFTAAGISPEE
jgi:hypothetical protein